MDRGSSAQCRRCLRLRRQRPRNITGDNIREVDLRQIDLKGHALTLRNVDDGKTLPDRWFASLKTQGRSDVYVVDNKFSPGATSGWHSHPGPSLILVVSGTVTNYTGDDPGCSPRTYSAGTGFVDPGGEDAHMLRNETADPAETIAVQLLPTGAPRKTDATAPANCPA